MYLYGRGPDPRKLNLQIISIIQVYTTQSTSAKIKSRENFRLNGTCIYTYMYIHVRQIEM